LSPAGWRKLMTDTGIVLITDRGVKHAGVLVGKAMSRDELAGVVGGDCGQDLQDFSR
jgi:hypothetical protein